MILAILVAYKAYDDNHVEFTDDFADDITLAYKDIIGIKLGDV